jgi:predicted CXXCH cytochrome family protein
MHGTFEFAGIDCEECHGAGKAHSLAPTTANIVKDVRSEPCGGCHTRDGQNRIAAKGNLVRHHEQFDELIRLRINEAGEVIEADGTVIPVGTASETRLELAAMGRHYVATPLYPDGVGCNGCHNAHATTKYDALTVEDGVIATCEDCHADKVRDSDTGMTVGFSGARLECIDCHMPLLSKSALSSAGLGSGPATGDIASHIFKIDPTQSEQFTADGKLSFPYLTTTFACMPCHGGDPESVSFIDLTGDDLTGYGFH